MFPDGTPAGLSPGCCDALLAKIKKVKAKATATAKQASALVLRDADDADEDF
jgi:hypothetical protein